MHDNPNYAQRKLAMECVSMSENAAYYSRCIFYKLHKYQHILNAWVCMQKCSLMLIIFKAGGPLGKK